MKPLAYQDIVADRSYEQIDHLLPYRRGFGVLHMERIVEALHRKLWFSLLEKKPRYLNETHDDSLAAVQQLSAVFGPFQ